MGSGGFCLCNRGCLCGSSILWTCDHQPPFRGLWLYGGDHFPAGLAAEGKRCHLWRAAAGVPGQRREHGFDGKPLQCFQAAAREGFLYSWGRDGAAAGLCDGGLWEFNPPDL